MARDRSRSYEQPGVLAQFRVDQNVAPFGYFLTDTGMVVINRGFFLWWRGVGQPLICVCVLVDRTREGWRMTARKTLHLYLFLRPTPPSGCAQCFCFGNCVNVWMGALKGESEGE